MAAAGNVQYMSEPVHRMVDVLMQRDGDMQQSIAGIKAQLQDLATTFVDIEDTDKVPGFRDLLKDLLRLENEVSMHALALQSSKQTYKASEETTDFKAMLEQKTQQLLSSHQFDPEASQDIKAFDRETGMAPSNEDDDLEIQHENEILKNDKCPLTMKSVFELQNPVADSMGFIYEKAAILSHLSGQPQVKCPVAGTSHYISRGDLKPAAQLERAKRRRKLNPNQPATQAQRVYDADDM